MPRFHLPQSVLGNKTPPPPAVRSVEYVTGTLALSTTQFDIALTKGQQLANCVPFVSCYEGYWTQSTVPSGAHLYYANIVNSGGLKMRVNRGYSNSTYIPLTIVSQVIEFNSQIVRVQKISWTMAISTTAADPTVPIAYDPAKTFIVNYYTSDTSAGLVPDDHEIRAAAVVGGATIALRRSFAGNAMTGIAYIVEDITDDNSTFRVQHHYNTAATTGNKDSTLTYSVDVAKTFVLCTLQSSWTSWIPSNLPIIPTLFDTNTVRINIPSMPNANTLQWTAQVIEWLDATECERAAYNYTSPATGPGDVPEVALGTVVSGRDRNTSIVTPAKMHSTHNCAIHTSGVSSTHHEMAHYIRPHASSGEVLVAYRNSGSIIQKTVVWQSIFFPYLVP